MELLSGTANPALSAAVAERLDVGLGDCQVSRFPDGELEVRVGPGVRGRDVYVLQSTGPPVHGHLMELLLLADACGRAGAARVTAVVPYLGYARQDRRTAPGEPVSVRVVGELLRAVGVARALVVDPHTPAVEAILGIPVERVTAVGVLADAVHEDLGADAVVVAPDLGAVSLAQEYGDHLDLPVAVVRKTRVSGEEVEAEQVIGDVEDATALLVDDMVATGGTLVEAGRALREAGAREEVLVAATHGLLVGPAQERLSDLPMRRFLLTDSVPPPSDLGLPVRRVGIAELLADAISRLHEGRPLDDLAPYR